MEKTLSLIAEVPGAPKAVGPYSVAVEAQGFLFLSGQLGLDPATGTLVSGGTKAEVEQVFKNISAVLKSQGCDLNRVVKSTIFLTDLGAFAEVNAVYAEFFGTHRPARTTIQIAKLPLNASVEIEVIVAKG